MASKKTGLAGGIRMNAAPWVKGRPGLSARSARGGRDDLHK